VDDSKTVTSEMRKGLQEVNVLIEEINISDICQRFDFTECESKSERHRRSLAMSKSNEMSDSKTTKTWQDSFSFQLYKELEYSTTRTDVFYNTKPGKTRSL
jgi:hypothetical protein